MFQHLKTTNDRNGNPRRLYVVYSDKGECTAIIDESYAGKPKELYHATELLEHDITPAEYKHTIEWAKYYRLYKEQ